MGDLFKSGIRELFGRRQQESLSAIPQYLEAVKPIRPESTKETVKKSRDVRKTNKEVFGELFGRDVVFDLTNPEQEAYFQELKKILWKALSDPTLVSQRKSQYLKMYFFEELSEDEIARKFAVRPEAVREGIKNAISNLRVSKYFIKLASGKKSLDI